MRLQTVTSVGKAPRPKRHNDVATPPSKLLEHVDPAGTLGEGLDDLRSRI